MNERLRQFLTMEDLTPARFAEIMDIQRSGISHLLAGRNKPSFEFIQKMMAAFPDLNSEWLILGKGKPYKTSDRTAPDPADLPLETASAISDEPDLFSANDEEIPDAEEVTVKIAESQPAENRVETAPLTAVKEKSARKIARITVFYTDGTFEER